MQRLRRTDTRIVPPSLSDDSWRTCPSRSHQLFRVAGTGVSKLADLSAGTSLAEDRRESEPHGSQKQASGICGVRTARSGVSAASIRVARLGLTRGQLLSPLDVHYPTDAAGRQQLADELSATGLKPTQPKRDFDRDKINALAASMTDGSFPWNKSSLQPVIFGPNDEILGGHHRVISAHLAGIDLNSVPGPRPQVRVFPVSFRPVFDWRCSAGGIII